MLPVWLWNGAPADAGNSMVSFEYEVMLPFSYILVLPRLSLSLPRPLTPFASGRSCLHFRYELLSAGLDAPVLRLWDLRYTSSTNAANSSSSKSHALREYRGHAPITSKPLKAITRPRWLVYPSGNDISTTTESSGPRALIAVQGEHTTKLTLYDAASGAVVSRGEAGGSATVLAPVAGFHHQSGSVSDHQQQNSLAPCVAVAFDDGQISLLGPNSE